MNLILGLLEHVFITYPLQILYLTTGYESPHLGILDRSYAPFEVTLTTTGLAVFTAVSTATLVGINYVLMLRTKE